MNDLSKVMCIISSEPKSNFRAAAFSPSPRCGFETSCSTGFGWCAYGPVPSDGLFLSFLVFCSANWAQSRARLIPGEWYLNGSLKWLSWTSWPIQTQPRSAFASHCNPRSQLPSLQSFYAWNCIPGNCLFSTLSLSLSYFWPFVLGWLQRSCLTLIKFNVLVAVPIRSVAQLEAQHTILKQNGSQWTFLNNIIFHNFKGSLVNFGPWRWSQSCQVLLYIVE